MFRFIKNMFTTEKSEQKQQIKQWCLLVTHSSLSQAKELYDKISKLPLEDIKLYQDNYRSDLSHKEMLEIISFIKE